MAPRTAWHHPATHKASQLALGGLMAWSATLVGHSLADPGPAPAAPPAEVGSPPPSRATAPAPSAAPGAGRTLVLDEPQPIGVSFDDDRALPREAAKVASYTIDARLDEIGHRVMARGTIEWKNTAVKAVPQIYLHLYLNAFKNNQTLFSRSPFGAGRSGAGTKHWGYVDVKSLRVREMNGEDVWPRAVNGSPEFPEDETHVSIELPRPVQPDELLHLDVEFEDVLPEIVERTGYARDFHMIGQWFPKVARLLPSGAWASFPFHAQSEFYSDFGAYDVTLNVAATLVVGATGTRTEERVEGGRRRLRYRADNVHDFAWTAWEHFRERRENVAGVDVRVLYPPGNQHNAEATLGAVRHGLDHFGSAFGRYPYPTLTVVHPPAFAPGASGMEYPTLITTGFPWYTGHLTTLVERVTLHELGHQWFYGLVATDEHASPFLDEGLTTYAEWSAMRARFGRGSAFSMAGLQLDDGAYERVLSARAGHDDIVALPAPEFASFGSLGALVYARTGTILSTLGGVYGEGEVRRAVGRYARFHRFRHPSPRHFVSAVREVMGDEAANFLSAALFQGGTLDFVAKDLRSARARPSAGVFGAVSSRKEIPEPDAESGDWLGRVMVYRHGTLQVPVVVEFRFEDGSTLRKTWDGRGPRAAIECQGKSRIVAAVVDPDLRIPLDDDLTNNTALAQPARSSRLVERALYATELLLGGLAP